MGAAYFASFSAPLAFAASANLDITGEIIVGACDIQTENNGVLDYGTIPNEDIAAGSGLALPTKIGKIHINCPDSTLIGFKLIDNRADSSATGEATALGLGFDSAENPIGHWSIDPATTANSSSAVSLIGSRDGGKTWQTYLYSTLMTTNTTFAVRVDNTPNVPNPWKNISVDLASRAYLQLRERLDLSTELELDGSITFELVYLQNNLPDWVA